MRRWQLVLIEPQEAGNVGAAARVAKNFGAGGLRVVSPRCEVNCPEARRFSSGAAELLRNAAVYTTLHEALADRELAIGLTGVSGRLHRLDCIGLVPSKLLEGKNHYQACALVFGREDRGMTGEEMERCSYLWSLPTNADFPSLNLAQAIGITLAAVAQAERELGVSELGIGLAPSEKTLNPLASSPALEDRPAAIEDIDRLSAHLRELMENTGWADEVQIKNSLAKFRNLFNRGNITKREVSLFHGIYRQALLAARDPRKFQRRAKP